MLGKGGTKTGKSQESRITHKLVKSFILSFLLIYKRGRR